MKNKKLNLTEMAKRTALLSTKEQKAVKGGYKFFGNDNYSSAQVKIIIADIRFSETPDRGIINTVGNNNMLSMIQRKG